VFRTALEQLHSARLYGSSIFKDARKDAESELRDQLKGQIDQFFELGTFSLHSIIVLHANNAIPSKAVIAGPQVASRQHHLVIL
jgi:hypothetical protein